MTIQITTIKPITKESFSEGSFLFPTPQNPVDFKKGRAFCVVHFSKEKSKIERTNHL
ncbi:hypothetical protein [Polaribacter sp. M15]